MGELDLEKAKEVAEEIEKLISSDELQEEKGEEVKEEKTGTKWVCPLCGYIHYGFDETGRDCVDGDVAVGQLFGNGAREPDHPGFRGGVVRLAAVADQAADTRNVDDPAVLLFAHRADESTR